MSLRHLLHVTRNPILAVSSDELALCRRSEVSVDQLRLARTSVAQLLDCYSKDRSGSSTEWLYKQVYGIAAASQSESMLMDGSSDRETVSRCCSIVYVYV